jgi:hypothetical protein
MKTILTAWFGTLIITSAFAAEQPWQVALRTESRLAASNIFCIPRLSGMRMHYTVPAAAARILKSRAPADLLPFLSELRAGSTPATAGVVEQWTLVVRRGLRGTPSVVPFTFGPGTNNLDVYVYTDKPLNQAR